MLFGNLFISFVLVCLGCQRRKYKRPLTKLFNPQLNPLTPERDWDLISPYIITAESNIKIATIQQLKNLLIVQQILLVSTTRNVKRTAWRK